MLRMDVVEACPYSVVGKGILKISHNVLSIFAGAVYDHDEWIALLVGTRDETGLNITVTDVKVPLQERNTASCELVNKEPLTPEIVGVVHSHHNMNAFFSQIDHDTLNPRFPMSIVVAQNKHTASEVESLLGFSYKAEGRAMLPCGSMGVVQFKVIPDPFIDGWPEVVETGYGEPNMATSLYDCAHLTKELVGFQHNCSTKCGLIAIEKATAVFGRESDAFMKKVQEKTKRKKYYGYVQQYPGYPVVDNRAYFKDRDKVYEPFNDREENYLRHWGYCE